MAMTRNMYNIKAELLTRKYGEILKDFEDAVDDRRIAWNIYQQLLEVCQVMDECNMENAFICCAVSDKIKEKEASIDNIITRFTGLVFQDYTWTEPLGDSHYYEVYLRGSGENAGDIRIEKTKNGHKAFSLAQDERHYVVLVMANGQRIELDN